VLLAGRAGAVLDDEDVGACCSRECRVEVVRRERHVAAELRDDGREALQDPGGPVHENGSCA
jgi:hypothetical protein